MVIEIATQDGSQQLDSINPSEFPDLDEYTLYASIVISGAWMVAKYFDIHPGLTVKIEELIRQGDIIMKMGACIVPGPLILGVPFDLLEPFEDQEKRCAPILLRVNLGPFRITLVSIVVGVPEPTCEIIEGRVLYKIEAKPLLFRHHVEKRDEESRFSAKDLLDSVITACEKESINSIIPRGMWEE